MARISDTNSYPNIVPDGEDYLILTDKTDALATKTATLNSISSFFASTSLQSTKVTLSTTQLLNLFSSPVTLIVAQGANTYIQIIRATVFFTYGTQAYDFVAGAGEIVLETGTDDAGSWAGSVYNSAVNVAYNSTLIENVKLSANSALTIKALTQNPTQGNGTAIVNILYRVITQS